MGEGNDRNPPLRVRRFTPGQTAAFKTSTWGLAFPLVTLATYLTALALSAWFWIRAETFASNTSGGAVFIVLKMLIILSLSFLAAGAMARTARALSGRRPRKQADLSVSGSPSIRMGLHGIVQLSWRLRPTESVVITLQCEVSSSIESTASTYRWSWETTVDGGPGTPGRVTRIPVSFTVPHDAPPSGFYEVEGSESRTVRWTLLLSVHPDGPWWKPPRSRVSALRRQSRRRNEPVVKQGTTLWDRCGQEGLFVAIAFCDH